MKARSPAPAVTAMMAFLMPLALLPVALRAGAASLYVEDFAYTAGSALVGQGGWAAHSAGGTNPITIASPGLTYPGYAGSSVGGMVGTMATSGEDADAAFASQTSGSVYAGFLVNVQSTQTAGDYFLHLMVSPTSTLFYDRVYLKKDASANTFGFGLRHSSAGTIQYTPTTFALNTTYLVVIKYTFVAGTGNDVVALYVNPALGGPEPSPTLTHSGTDGPGIDASAIAGISLRQGTAASASTQQVDGIRVATTWSDIVGTTVHHTITASAGAGGTIAPSGAVQVVDGTNASFTITPNACFSIANVQVDGGSVGAVASYSFSAVTTDHTIAATFLGLGPYSITASAGAGGTIAPSGAVSVGCGANQTFTITPDACHTIAGVLVDGSAVGAVASYTFSNAGANHTIAASFATIAYTITASAATGGTIAPSGAVGVGCGGSQAFTIAPSAGWQIAGVTVDGGSVGAVTSYTFSNVTAAHTIAASFVAGPATVNAQSSATYICPAHTCVVFPVMISRIDTTPLLGYSVRFQLSPNLALCTGIGSITEGAYLSSAGTTFFNVIDHGSGSYSVDDAVATCGPTAANGLLFSVGVTSTAASGPGTLTVTSIRLRDCANGTLAVSAGPPATVPIDNEPPVVTLTSPTGGEVWAAGSTHPITWTATDNTGVANVDLAYSTDGGATYANVIATAIANSGSYAWQVPGSPPTQVRVQVTAHDVVCSSGSAASDVVGIQSALGVGTNVTATELAPVAPNPALGGAIVQYALATRGPVDLAIYAIDGRLVKTLSNGVQEAGRYQIHWNGMDEHGVALRSGMYFVRFHAAGVQKTRLITLMR